MYPAPTPLYDIHSNDYSHPSYVDQFHRHFNTGYGELLYPQQSFNGMLAPTFQNPNGVLYHQSPNGGLASAFPPPNGFTSDGRLAPVFQYNYVPPLFTSSPSSSSQSSLSFEATLTPTPGPFLRNIPQFYPELEDNLPQPIAAPSVAPGRRARRPNKGSGMGFTDMFDQLPEDVQVALDAYYPGCCREPEQEQEQKKQTRDCTRQKHMFSRKHTRNLSEDMQKLVPFFICPAYVALHGQCRSAKAGRLDAADRHCEKCPGFQEINSKHKVSPVWITQNEYDAVKIYREEPKNPSAEIVRLVTIPITKLLVMMMRAGMSLEPAESDVSDAMNVTAAEPLGQPSPVEAENDDEFGQGDMFFF